ncbi:MAG: ribonuclease Z, partial [Flavobacteriaceae bacterium]
MKVDQKGHTTIIKDTQNNTEAFVGKITNEYHMFQGQNL